MFLYVFKYFILLLCIITFNIDYCYVLLHSPSHVWPEFIKLLSIVYWEHKVFWYQNIGAVLIFLSMKATGTTH